MAADKRIRPRRWTAMAMVETDTATLRHRTGRRMTIRRLGLVMAATCALTCVAAFTTSQNKVFHQRKRGSLLLLPAGGLPPSRRSRRSSVLMAPRRAEADDEEWEALVAAFRMYKAAYGDLKVPLRFIVPGMPPWPEKAWSLKLGQKVAAIRSTGKYVQNNEERRKRLEDMGFQWSLRNKSPDKNARVSLDQVYSALVTYRSEVHTGNGPLTVPPTFVVPDCEPWPEATRGLPLGKRIPMIRSKAFLKANPAAKERLEALGLDMSGNAVANDTRFQKVYDALKAYKEIHGDLLVPQPFVVPDNSDDWPESTWGLRLGARVNAIRSQGTFVSTNAQRRQELDDLGFVWSPPQADRGRKRVRKRREEAETETSSGSPVEQYSPLERQATDEESAETGSSTLESLFGPSFAFGAGTLKPKNGEETDAPSWGFETTADFEAARAAEVAAKQPAENYKPKKNLLETLNEAAQKAASVGVIKEMTEDNRIRKGKQFKEIPWYNDDFGGDFVFEDVVEALTVYQSIHGDFSGLENEEFVVPTPDGAPRNMFGDDDDTSFDAEASTRAAAAIAAFEEEGKMDESEDLIAAEIRRLQEENAHVAVASDTSVSSGEWPEHLGGMVLGNIVQRIRDGSLEVKHLPERKAQLDMLDFEWGDEKYFIDVPFEKAMCAMYAYYLVRGDMFVYEDFVMPDEDPWPQALAGYELGKAVRRIRELQNFFEAYHLEKVSLLRAIDFVWFPTLALPLDPNETEMSPEMLLVSAMGHPDYAKMIDIPMGLPDKIMADGPFFESDDPKMWWRTWHNWEYVKDYWYAQGRRDNAFVLRGMGYSALADEHEAKYGPGLFAQINVTMQELEDGIEQQSQEEKEEYLTKLNFFREEMTDCRDIHPVERRNLLEDLDFAMLALTTDGKLERASKDVSFGQADYTETEDEVPEVEEEEIDDDEDDEDDMDEDILDEDVEDDDDIDEADDFDIGDELGLTDEGSDSIYAQDKDTDVEEELV